LTATVRRGRPRAAALGLAAALALASTTAASAQEDPGGGDQAPEEQLQEEQPEGDQPEEEQPEEEEFTLGPVSCDAELLDDEEDEEEFPFYLVEPGDTLTCTASELDPATDAEWVVDVYGFTEDDDAFALQDDDEEFDDDPYATFGSDGPLTPSEDGELTFSFTVPEELVFGVFDGMVWQGDPEAATYEAYFGGLIFGFTLGDMTCDDPAVRGTETTCEAELTPGEFEWEVYELTVRDLLDWFGPDVDDDDGDFEDGDVEDEDFEDEPEPTATGVGEADEDGLASFAFTLPRDGDAEVLFAVAYQEDAVAFHLGEIAPAEESPDGGSSAPRPAEGAAPVAVPRPNRVEAGGGGSAPTDRLPAAVLLLALASAATVAVRRIATLGR
jgi:hypothetical protein